LPQQLGQAGLQLRVGVGGGFAADGQRHQQLHEAVKIVLGALTEPTRSRVGSVRAPKSIVSAVIIPAGDTGTKRPCVRSHNVI